MSSRQRFVALAAGAALALAGTGAAAAASAPARTPASMAAASDHRASVSASGPHWGAAGRAPVHPGSTVVIAGTHCTVGFVLASGHRVFLAVPASCTGVSAGQATDGCSEAQVPPGLPVTIRGARHKGVVVYSSFTAMQLHSEHRSNRCADNSLALILVNRRDVRRVNPTVPLLGGPNAMSTATPSQGATLYAYIKNTTTALATRVVGGGWAEQIVPAASTDTTDVGSPVLTRTGRALGMVTVVQQTSAGPAVVDRLDHELRYLRGLHGFHHVHLARGTRRYSPPSAL